MHFLSTFHVSSAGSYLGYWGQKANISRVQTQRASDDHFLFRFENQKALTAVTPLLIPMCLSFKWMGGKRWKAARRQRKHWNAALSILQLFRLACICVRKRYVRPGVHRERPFWKVSLLCGVNSSLTSQKKAQLQTREAIVCCQTSSFHLIIVGGFFQQTKYPQAPKGKLGITSWVSLPTPPSAIADSAPIPAGPPHLWVFPLPPGEEGSSALETLCVGLAVGSLRCSGRFNNYWGHLDQL